MEFLQALKNRRSIYNLGTNVNLSNEEITSIISDCLKYSPSAFNYPTTNVIIALLAFGTILFFEDTEIINELKETYAMYAENFSTWSNQANGMLQNNIWTALSQANIGANLQHYNPLIDDKIKELFSIPDTWKLTAQMPFGSIEAQPNEKYIEDISTRLKIY